MFKLRIYIGYLFSFKEFFLKGYYPFNQASRSAFLESSVDL